MNEDKNIIVDEKIVCNSHAGVVAGSAFANGETQDSVRVHHIQEVVVTSRLISRETIPSQTLGGEELKKLNSLSVADALRYFSGLQLKDYGGVGGIKTVNIRSMGTNHLGIFYDGIELGNAQNGQIDLGQFSLDNVEKFRSTTVSVVPSSNQRATLVMLAPSISVPRLLAS